MKFLCAFFLLATCSLIYAVDSTTTTKSTRPSRPPRPPRPLTTTKSTRPPRPPRPPRPQTTTKSFVKGISTTLKNKNQRTTKRPKVVQNDDSNPSRMRSYRDWCLGIAKGKSNECKSFNKCCVDSCKKVAKKLKRTVYQKRRCYNDKFKNIRTSRQLICTCGSSTITTMGFTVSLLLSWLVQKFHSY